MNSYLASILAMLVSAAVTVAREPAHVTFYCTSLRFAPTTGGPGQVVTLQLTTDPALSEINGEVGAFFDPQLPTHGAFFRIEDPSFPDSIVGRIAFDTPEPVDANGNGFNDFFEVSQGTSASTRGFFETSVENGSVSAAWSRAAGASTGTCRLILRGQTFGELPTFTPTFELLEYQGTLTYEPAADGIAGTLALTQTQNPLNTISASPRVSRVETNRFNDLILQAGNITNAAGQALNHEAADLVRDESSQTNYFGFVDFEDGDPTTGTTDYRTWVLSIDDPNDSDADGIPDLSDDPTPGPPAAPILTLIRSGTELLLNIRGSRGRVFDLEHVEALPPINWAKAMSVTLSNESQTLSLPIPTNSNRFWRLKAP